MVALALPSVMFFYYHSYTFFVSLLPHDAIIFSPSPPTPVKRLYALSMTIMDGGCVRLWLTTFNLAFALFSFLPYGLLFCCFPAVCPLLFWHFLHAEQVLVISLVLIVVFEEEFFSHRAHMSAHILSFLSDTF